MANVQQFKVPSFGNDLIYKDLCKDLFGGITDDGQFQDLCSGLFMAAVEGLGELYPDLQEQLIIKSNSVFQLVIDEMKKQDLVDDLEATKENDHVE